MCNNDKQYNLEDRTFTFAKQVMDYVEALPRTITNIEIGRQLTRSGGSVGANYIEANESLSKKDFYHRIRICRKEAKESGYWLKLITAQINQNRVKLDLIQEAIELTKIFGSILEKSKKKF